MICYTTRLKITRISRTVSELKRESPKCLPEKQDIARAFKESSAAQVLP